jgi:hypothetical protein
MRRPLVYLALLMAAGACGGDEPTDGPVPGEVIATLTTPNAKDGALLIRIVGSVKDVAGIGSYRASAATAGTTTRVVLTGSISGGDVLRFSVPDTRNIGSYTILVEQVADRDSYALLETSGYQLSLRVK